MALEGLGFALSLVAIITVSRWNLAVGLIGGALLLGVFALPPAVVVDRIVFTATDPTVLLLGLAMSIIPILGGTMGQSGQIDQLINHVGLTQRYLLPFSAALMGLLPMPGGALLSAPILERGGVGVDAGLKAAINNWFRHLFILVYPLNPALIVSAKICELDVYRAISVLIPGALLAAGLGYVFFLRHVPKVRNSAQRFSPAGLGIPLGIIVSAPVLDFFLKRIFGLGALATLIAVTVAVGLSMLASKERLSLGKIVLRMKPWNFGFIIFGMFLYLHVFQATGVQKAISGLPLPPLFLAVLAGFALGLMTGRVQLPASVVFPVYLGTAQGITLPLFALIFTAVYFGYIISPVHPCLVVTCQYFRIPLGRMIALLGWPTAIVLACVLTMMFIFL